MAETQTPLVVPAVSQCCGAPLWIVARCTGSCGGHRQPVNGVAPRQTREHPPVFWAYEVLGRFIATRIYRWASRRGWL